MAPQARGAFALVGLSILLAILLYGIPSPSSDKPVARGRVVDARTGTGIPGARVLVTSTTHDPSFFLPGRQIEEDWIGTSDSAGSFAIPGPSTKDLGVSVVAPSYATIVAGMITKNDSTLRMRRESATSRKMIVGDVSVPMHAGPGTVALDLDLPAMTTDSKSAEILIRYDASANPVFEVRATDSSVLQRIPTDRSVAWSWWERCCEAPLDGYVRTDSLIRGDNFFYFVSRSGSETRYGRFRVIVAIAHDGPFRPDPAGGSFLIASVLNPAGTRELCPEPTRGEADVLERMEKAATRIR